MASAISCSGSSPRPWGTLPSPRLGGPRERFIPTPVGNTSPCQRERRPRAVHPHARGEHADRLSQAGPHRRFIPTPVGNTERQSRRGSRHSVHPHARGEHAIVQSEVFDLLGSSPRPWGTPGAGAGALGRRRFIPTPVGNTAAARTASGMATVHPHARGEHRLATFDDALKRGSSPRPWGTLADHPWHLNSTRFIPTPVGNTRRRRVCRRAVAVHPHARGEHVLKESISTTSNGSSPRPWGTRPNTGPNTGRTTVHPHARGEHAFGGFYEALRDGSSPRPWGTRYARPGTAGRWRFIPTPVGNTSPPRAG